ncbi:TIR domain-containing protein [Komagataeibacter europaeus]|uniref:TIR domain-containing protein n=1 Tax=Komagataeibacter europaeus TaxID=33995 RepID=UPI000494A0B4|nr:TIR domain-containing protein [Komagataeibacter europaeus]
MAKTRVFISFDYDHDSFLKEALVGQSKLPDSPFELADWSIKEHIDGDWKAKATSRIRSVDVVVVVCGEHTNTAVGVSAELNIARSEGKPYFLLAGYNDKTNVKPSAANTSDKMYNWTWPNLKLLIAGGR